MSSGCNTQDLVSIVLSVFHMDIEALKPGNVSQYADGHGMTREVFDISAKLVTPILCDTALTVGERILQSVTVTRAEVGCNTNLGMLLLLAPIIVSAENCPSKQIDALQKCLIKTLDDIDQTDTVRIFEAISLANPGGLGRSEEFDVTQPTQCRLQIAMAAARNRDTIAKQYVTGFSDVFLTGLSCIKEFNIRWNRVEWSAVACYLTFLAGIPDSHIQRKYGPEVAENIKTRAAKVAEQFKNNDDPASMVDDLLDFDRELKKSDINPGTSADLTAASLLVYELTQ